MRFKDNMNKHVMTGPPKLTWSGITTKARQNNLPVCVPLLSTPKCSEHEHARRIAPILSMDPRFLRSRLRTTKSSVRGFVNGSIHEVKIFRI